MDGGTRRNLTGQQVARGSGRARTPDTQPQRLISTPVMTLGAARTPCLLPAQLNLSKNTRKGPLPPTHQAPRKPMREVTACPPHPTARSLPSCLVGRLPRCPQSTWDRRGRFHLSPHRCVLGPRRQVGKPVGEFRPRGLEGPPAGTEKPGRQRGGNRCSSGLFWQLGLGTSCEPGSHHRARQPPPCTSLPWDWGKNGQATPT